MKQLKFYNCIACTCERTGKDGDFIIDIEYFRQTGKKASLNNLVFDNLVEMFRFANKNSIPTCRIYSDVLPTYWESEKDIKDLLAKGIKVYWKDKDCEATQSHDGLYVTFKYNGYRSKLQEDEYKDCFIFGGVEL